MINIIWESNFLVILYWIPLKITVIFRYLQFFGFGKRCVEKAPRIVRSYWNKGSDEYISSSRSGSPWVSHIHIRVAPLRLDPPKSDRLCNGNICQHCLPSRFPDAKSYHRVLELLRFPRDINIRLEGCCISRKMACSVFTEFK